MLHYSCDEGQGDVVADDSGLGNGGRVIDAAWIRHGAGSALAFAGGDARVDCGNGPSLDLREALTLSACVRSDGRQTREGALILKDPESYGLTLYLDGNIYFYVGGGGHNLKAPFPVAEGEPGFHHIAAACDGETMRLYIDGRPAGQRPQELPLKPGGNLYLGRGTDPGTSLQGALDEVRVYNRALSETEIRAEYRALSGAGLVDGEPLPPEPWALTAPIEGIKQFETLTVTNGRAPVAGSVSFPAVVKRPDSRVVLRFESRLAGYTPGGWNWFAGLQLNGKPVFGFTANGTPRLVNRKPEITVDEGRPYNMSWWGQVGGLQTSLLTFFGPGGGMLDERVLSDRQELYWHIVDITDLVNYREIGLDERVVSDEPNTLEVTNNVLYQYVQDREINLVLDGLTVGYLPEDIWRERVGEFTTHVEPLSSPAARLQGSGYELQIGAGGSMQVVSGGQPFGITSSFSHPGEQIGYNLLAESPGEGQETGWQPEVLEGSADEVRLRATGESYALERSVRIEGHRIRVSDRLMNLSDRPTGIIIKHLLAAPEAFQSCLLGGAPDLMAPGRAENPTIFAMSDGAGLGVYLEDTVLRLQCAMATSPKTAAAQVEHFCLDAGEEYTADWLLYPMPSGNDYWDFINRVRGDIGVDYTILGPWSFFHVQSHRDLLQNPEALKAYLERKDLGVVAVMPWLDYDNMNLVTGELTTRDEYKQMMREAAAAFRAVKPDIKLIGCIESFPAQLSLEDAQTLVDRIPGSVKTGWVSVAPELFEGLQSVPADRMACALRNPEGQMLVESYSRSGFEGPTRAMVALVTYPTLENAQHAALMDQARFLMEDCELDGLYIDCFSFSYDGAGARLRYSDEGWDGRTCDIDPETGAVTKRYVDAGLVGADARAALINSVLERGGVFVGNSYASVKQTQALGAFRFSESEYNFDPLAIGEGEKPPLFYRMTGSHLGSPIGLGYRPDRLGQAGTDNYAGVMMKTVITYLRHGALTYHYQTEIPTTGPGAGEYGPFNQMFPMTIQELHEGYIIGRERTITAVSGTFHRAGERKPEVLVFDITGRAIIPEAEVKQVAGGWDVELTLQDWESVAVIK